MQQLPLHSHPGWGCLSVCLSVLLSYQTPDCPAALAPAGPTASSGRSVINGARGAPGAGQDQRGPKRWALGWKERHGESRRRGQRDRQTRDTEAELCGDTEAGGSMTQRQIHGDPETRERGQGASNQDSQGKNAGKGTKRDGEAGTQSWWGGPYRTEAGNRDGRSGRQRPRDGRDACERDGGGAWEQGLERRSHGSSL